MAVHVTRGPALRSTGQQQRSRKIKSLRLCPFLRLSPFCVTCHFILPLLHPFAFPTLLSSSCPITTVWLKMQDLKMTDHSARRESAEQDVKSVHYKRLSTKCLRVPVSKIFTSLAKKYYYYNTTYLLWSPYGIGQTIIFSCCGLFFLLLLFFLA